MRPPLRFMPGNPLGTAIDLKKQNSWLAFDRAGQGRGNRLQTNPKAPADFCPVRRTTMPPNIRGAAAS
jgi:hypothetical protein